MTNWFERGFGFAVPVLILIAALAIFRRRFARRG